MHCSSSTVHHLLGSHAVCSIIFSVKVEIWLACASEFSWKVEYASPFDLSDESGSNCTANHSYILPGTRTSMAYTLRWHALCCRLKKVLLRRSLESAPTDLDFPESATCEWPFQSHDVVPQDVLLDSVWCRDKTMAWC